MRESFHPKGVHRGSQALKQASGIVTFLGTMGKCLPRYNILEEGLTLHHYLRAQFSMAENEEVANHCDSRHLLPHQQTRTQREIRATASHLSPFPPFTQSGTLAH